MAKIFTTEITSETIASDNPIHQRLYKAYVVAKDYVMGDVLEVGCGEGRGISLLMSRARSFTAVDKIATVIEDLKKRFPAGSFKSMNIPPLGGLQDNAYDVVFSFQVIEHIKDDALFLQEIHRVLKPGGKAVLTTPNRRMSLSRNPWHVREYLPDELANLASKFFSNVEMKGIAGNEKVMAYHEENRKSVNRLMRWDVLKMQYWLPAPLLRIPYEILNRWNRNKLQTVDNMLVNAIRHEDYVVADDARTALDLLLIVTK
ncbi:MAG TPA: class I SAM-dependent methyltransferase [Chryseosolibacter sp.]|nr:class I SAM-dependent methyltransferase [Chryseosolibacter sp.]